MGRRRALIVATGRYDDPKLKRLRAPDADADRLAEVLGDPEIGDFEVTVARDSGEHELTRTIARFYGSSARDDVLLLHVSGHGIKDARGRLFLAASDTELDLLDATAIAAAWLDDQIAHAPSRSKLLLLDCCFSGKFPFNSTARAGNTVDVQEQFHGRGRAVITASDAMEYAYEGDELSGEGQPSYFTGAIVDGLTSGEADRDGDRWISVDELYEYVYDRVKVRSPNQTPGKQSLLHGPLYVARSKYERPVEPATLDRDLLDLVESTRMGARLGAVEELAVLLGASNHSVALAARQALESMREDDSLRVQHRVTAVLGGPDPEADEPAAIVAPAATAPPEPAATAPPELAPTAPPEPAAAPEPAATAPLEPAAAPKPSKRPATPKPTASAEPPPAEAVASRLELELSPAPRDGTWKLVIRNRSTVALLKVSPRLQGVSHLLREPFQLRAGGTRSIEFRHADAAASVVVTAQDSAGGSVQVVAHARHASTRAKRPTARPLPPEAAASPGLNLELSPAPRADGYWKLVIRNWTPGPLQEVTAVVVGGKKALREPFRLASGGIRSIEFQHQAGAPSVFVSARDSGGGRLQAVADVPRLASFPQKLEAFGRAFGLLGP